MKHTSGKRRYEAMRPAEKGDHVSLDQLKAQALRASASARNDPVSDVREAFGFMPVGIQGVVIRWPSL